MLLAWELAICRAPFADDVTPESRVLIRRLIGEIVTGIAPFLIYDSDPYIVIDNEGRLHWMIDALHGDRLLSLLAALRRRREQVNYIRNSVKVVIDAYNGSVGFYVFDNQRSAHRRLRRCFRPLSGRESNAGRSTLPRSLSGDAGACAG